MINGDARTITEITLPSWDRVRQVCAQSPIGKRLPDALYVHRSAIDQVDPLLQEIALLGIRIGSQIESESKMAEKTEIKTKSTVQLDLTPEFYKSEGAITIVKIQLHQPQISYLGYPGFDTDPHPALAFSIVVNLDTQTRQWRDYQNTANPPILHRKETLVAIDYPHFDRFAELTRQEETFGLLKESRQIGTRLNWQRRLRENGLEIHDHVLASSLERAKRLVLEPLIQSPVKPTIDRHKAAIHRNALSKPVRLAVEAGLIPPGTAFFDYGCGHGDDVNRLAKAGCMVDGWDPYYRPNTPWMPAEVVNLGYIINVIEDPAERREALINAWQLTRQVLIVSAQVLVEDANQGWLAYGDGVITSRNTFQKYYQQEELKSYIDQVLGVDAIPIALGIYGVFRDAAQAQAFRARPFRSRTISPRVSTTVRRFEDYRSLLQTLMDFYADRGRLPTTEEIAAREDFQAIIQVFKGIKPAFNLILRATNPTEWDAIRDQRRQDWLVYLALTQFGKRPKFSELDRATQADLKGLFGSYSEACTAADLMLMSIGNLDMIRESCQRSPLGLRYKDSLWIHSDRLESLEALLRLYEGCGARTFGRPEGAIVVRLHWKQAAITYYTPGQFDEAPHPILLNAMKIDLRSARVHYWEYDRSDNPPILVCKDKLVSPDYPHYRKFAKLSQQECQWGILDSLDQSKQWWTKQKWEQHCGDRGASFKGHRLVWRKDLDPYQRSLLEAQKRSGR